MYKYPEGDSGYLQFCSMPPFLTYERTSASNVHLQRTLKSPSPGHMEEAGRKSECTGANIQHSDLFHMIIRSEYGLNQMDLINHPRTKQHRQHYDIASFTGNHRKQFGRLPKPGSMAICQEKWRRSDHPSSIDFIPGVMENAELRYIILKSQETWAKQVIKCRMWMNFKVT